MSTDFLRGLFDFAVASVQPAHCIPPHIVDILANPPEGKLIVIGAGKASAAMAKALEDELEKSEKQKLEDLSGLIVTRYGYAVPCCVVVIVEAAHPIPDQAGEQASKRILEMVSNLTPRDLVVCLFSGGGSALLSLPSPGITLADKQALNQALLRSGASIQEINCVRKHLSAIKGGRLAAACHPARVVTLAISDVPGDEFSVIASGPTVPDPTTRTDTLRVLAHYQLDVSPSVRLYLDRDESETPKPGDPRMEKVETRLVATPQQMLDAIAKKCIEAGWNPLILSDRIEGEAREVAKVHAAIAKQIQQQSQPAPPPIVILSGGETTVTVKGIGRGGPNTEFGLSLLIALKDTINIAVIACDTDGIDGTENNAGVCFSSDLIKVAQMQDLDPASFLYENDSYNFFQKTGALVTSGPTFTNVNDFRAICVESLRLDE